MTKAFSLVSWNVEHFRGKERRTDRIVRFLSDQKADVFALYEVEGKTVFRDLVTRMPGYQFHITEGPQVQEILVGVKRNLTAFFTQRVTFRSGMQFLRPGAFLTLTIDGEDYSILFLHTKSNTKPIGLGVRDDQFSRAFKFKKVLDKAALKDRGARAKANFLFLGDLNTMGMKYPFQKNIEATLELKNLDRNAKKVKMRRLTKTSPATWWNGPGSRYAPADLDHVIAAEHLNFRQFSGMEIRVKGWPELDTPKKQGDWIKKHSDHGLLYLDVQKTSG
jgi:endonuclease/exonuclease/phosphatase family metal-dependent hydrolase